MSSSDKQVSTSKEDTEPASSMSHDCKPQKLSLRALDSHTKTREEDLEHGPLLLGIDPNSNYIVEYDVADDLLEDRQRTPSGTTTVVSSQRNVSNHEIPMFDPANQPPPPSATLIQSESTSGETLESTTGGSSTHLGKTSKRIESLAGLLADLRLQPAAPSNEALDDSGLGLGSANLETLHPEKLSRLEDKAMRLRAVILGDTATSRSRKGKGIDVGAYASSIPEKDAILSPWNFEFAWTDNSLTFAGEELKAAKESFEAISLRREVSAGVWSGSSSSVFNSATTRSAINTLSARPTPQPKRGPIAKLSPKQMEAWFAHLTEIYVRAYKPNAKRRQPPPPRYRQVNGNSSFRKLAPAPPTSRTRPSKRLKPDGDPGDGSDDEGGDDGYTSASLYYIPPRGWRNFVCPFIWRYPDANFPCAYKIRKISCLKDHLRKKHRLLYCKDCLRVCDSPASLASHRQHRPCPEVLQWSPPQFITDEQFAFIQESFKGKGMSHYEQYQYIYKVLFPDDHSCPYPYMSNEDLELMKELATFVRQEGRRIIMGDWGQVMSIAPLVEFSEKVVHCRRIIQEWIPHAMAENRGHSGIFSGHAPNPSFPCPIDDSDSMPQLVASLPETGPLMSLSNNSSANTVLLPVVALEQNEETRTQEFEAHLQDHNRAYGNLSDRSWVPAVDSFGVPIREEVEQTFLCSYNGPSWSPSLDSQLEACMAMSDMRNLGVSNTTLPSGLEPFGIDGSVINEDWSAELFI